MKILCHSALKLTVCLLLLNSGMVTAAALTNGGFEAGNLSGFTQSGFYNLNGGPDSGGPNYKTYVTAKSATGAAFRASSNAVAGSQTTAFNGFTNNGPAILPTQGGNLAFVSNTLAGSNGGMTGSEISQTFDIPAGITQLKVDVALLNSDSASSFHDYDDFAGVVLLSGAVVVGQYNLDLDPASAANAHVTVGNTRGGFSNAANFRTVLFDVSSYQGKSLTFTAYAINYGGDNLTETRLLLDNLVLDAALPTKVALPYDFNGDGHSDIIWKNANGDYVGWLMAANGFNPTAYAVLQGGSQGITLVSARADFNGDGNADIVWKNSNDGSYALWLMNGLQTISRTNLSPGIGAEIAQLADFNGDGRADILWQWPDGRSLLWLMNGANTVNNATLRTAGSGWIATKTTDLNGDGKADLIWTHTNGAIEAWLMNGVSPLATQLLLDSNSGWTVTAAGDFDADGKADLLLSHSSGAVTQWLMDGFTLRSSRVFLNGGTGWSVYRLGDFNADAKSDIVWKHADGTYSLWLLNSADLIGATVLQGANSGYVLEQIADYNGDGRSDFLWQRSSTGVTEMWQLNNTAVTAAAVILDGSGGWVPSHN